MEESPLYQLIPPLFFFSCLSFVFPELTLIYIPCPNVLHISNRLELSSFEVVIMSDKSLSLSVFSSDEYSAHEASGFFLILFCRLSNNGGNGSFLCAKFPKEGGRHSKRECPQQLLECIVSFKMTIQERLYPSNLEAYTN